MSTAHQCLVWAVAGAVLGLAIVAHGQDPVASAPVDPAALTLLDLLRTGGLPAVLALITWLVQRGGIPVVLRLSDDDRRLLRRLRPKPDPDDSESSEPRS